MQSTQSLGIWDFRGEGNMWQQITSKGQSVPKVMSLYVFFLFIPVNQTVAHKLYKKQISLSIFSPTAKSILRFEAHKLDWRLWVLNAYSSVYLYQSRFDLVVACFWSCFVYLHFKQALKFIKGFTVKLQQSVSHCLLDYKLNLTWTLQRLWWCKIKLCIIIILSQYSSEFVQC